MLDKFYHWATVSAQANSSWTPQKLEEELESQVIVSHHVKERNQT